MIKPLLVDETPGGGYHEHPRYDISSVILEYQLGGRILDVGCGAGTLGHRLLDEGIADEVVGIELDVEAAQAASRSLSAVVNGNISEPDVLRRIIGRFDLIVAADVLEHLPDPEAVLANLVALMKPDGALIVSVPNIRNFRVLARLVFNNDWRYESEGICDSTHLRFFTSRSLGRLIMDAGLNLEAMYGTVAGRSGKLARLVPRLTTFAAVQVIAIARASSVSAIEQVAYD